MIPDIDVFFRKASALFASDPNLVGLTSKIKVLPEYETLFDKIIFGYLNFFHLLMNNLLGIGVSSGEFQMVRRDSFKKIGGYNEKLVASEDYDLFKRLSNMGKTRYDGDLVVYHTGRRAHKIGWPKLLSMWFLNTVSVWFRKRSVSSEWKDIR